MLTLQQAEAAPRPQMTAPVIPEDVPLRCRYDAGTQAWHCSYEAWYQKPSMIAIGLVGILGLGLGFLIAAFPPVRHAVATVQKVR